MRVSFAAQARATLRAFSQRCVRSVCAHVQHVGQGRRGRDLAVGDAVQLGYAARSVAPHASYKASLFVAESAVVESKADTKLDTRSTFHTARFWSNADAVWNSCEQAEHCLKTSPRTPARHWLKAKRAGGAQGHHGG